jgi:glycosyltransferase involved in cell wall biosynthesis
MHSSLPQQLSNFKFTTSKLLISIFKKLEDTCLKKADAIITICPDLANYVNGLIQEKEKHFLIENSIFDPVKILPKSSSIDKDRALTKPMDEPVFLLEDKKVVVYAGTLEPYQGIDILIHAFKYVVDERPDTILLIVGGTGSQVEKYTTLAENFGLGARCIFTGRVPQALAKYYTSLASILVSPRSEGTNTPLKIYEQIASGIPLVATNIYSHTQVLNDDVAFLVQPNPQALARGILSTLDGDGRRIASNAKHFYQENYSRPVYEKKMRQLLDLLSEPTS